MNTATLEADTRILIDKSLENLGWVLNGKHQNVYYERPKTSKEQKLLGGERPDYVLYSKDERGKDKAIMVIEAKRRGARVDTALEQGIRYAKQLDAPIVFATDGLFCKSYHTKFDRTPILNGEEVDEFLREALAIQYLSSWKVNTISPKVQYDRKELIKIFDEANNMLRGDGLRAGIERFGEFANILFLKLISENKQVSDSSIKTVFDDSCHWDTIKSIPKSGRIVYVNQVFGQLNKTYGTDIFTPLTIRSDDILKEIMDKLDPLTLTDVDSDVKGDAFEYFLKESTSIKNDLGEYFTPRHIVKTMVKLVNPQIGEKIYDPFCGTGGFLIESFRHIWNTMPRNSTTKNMLKQSTIYGNEITNTARITKMNMILAGDGHSNIHMQDSLANPVDGSTGEGYDVVITNMPYSQKSKYGNLYDLPSNNGDSICVQHCMKAINSTAENGRMALVVPEGFLFRKDLSKTRELLLKNCDLQSVISLPQGVFLPYTGVKTNIIYVTKVNGNLKVSQKRKNFWYFNVKSDGYTLDNHRRKLESHNDLDTYQEYRKLDDDQRQAMLDVGFEVVPLDKVKENSFVLVGSRYRKSKQVDLGYKSVSLDELIDIACGTRITQQHNTGSKYPVYGGGGQSFFTDEYTRENDYVVSRFGVSEHCVRYVEGKFYLLDSGFTFNVKKELQNYIDKDYIGKILLGIQAKIFELSRGQAQRNMDLVLFKSVEIPVPSIEVQKGIVNELDSYKCVIDGAKAVVENYRPKFLINPKWDTAFLADVCSFEYGYTDIASNQGDTRFVRITDINAEGTLSNKELKYVNLTDENKKYILKQNDILVARIGATFGKTLLFTSEEAAIFASYLIRLTLKNNVLPKYYFYFAQSEYYWQQARSLVTGGGQPQFNANTLKLIRLPIPPLEVQHRIITQIEAEQALVAPSKQLIEVFTKKMQTRINDIWSE